MSEIQSRLSKWNDAFGYPIQKNRWFTTRRKNVLFKFLTFFPSFSLIVAIRNRIKKEQKTSIPKLVWARLILTATVLGIPLALVLDIFSTLITQPIGRCQDYQIDASFTFPEISESSGSDAETQSLEQIEQFIDQQVEQVVEQIVEQVDQINSNHLSDSSLDESIKSSNEESDKSVNNPRNLE